MNFTCQLSSERHVYQNDNPVAAGISFYSHFLYADGFIALGNAVHYHLCKRRFRNFYTSFL